MKNKIAIVLLLVMGVLSGARAYAGIELIVKLAPPPIVVFDQTACPGDGYIWTPGYYQYGDYGYYWVPGQWVLPPSVGLLWTPGYLGLRERQVCLARGVLGPESRFLRRHQLRQRLHRGGLHWRTLGGERLYE
jgi:hypothetical protein